MGIRIVPSATKIGEVASVQVYPIYSVMFCFHSLYVETHMTLARLSTHLRLLGILSVLLLCTTAGRAETIARCGDGWLEEINGYLVLHLKGTPYEMGYQQGALLKDHCQQNLNFMLNEKAKQLIKIGPVRVNPRGFIDGILAVQKPFVPKKFFDELDGLAAGAELKPADVYACNFIPELFHCSGFAVMNSATKDGTLYHGRVLDYSCDWRLQEHAVLVVAEPDGGIPFVNVTYAGFIGSVTGMNAQHVSIGEMGGLGLGHWSGVPMAFLMREVLETANDLEEAVDVFPERIRERACTTT